jgi:hypothetical protein
VCVEYIEYEEKREFGEVMVGGGNELQRGTVGARGNLCIRGKYL